MLWRNIRLLFRPNAKSQGKWHDTATTVDQGRVFAQKPKSGLPEQLEGHSTLPTPRGQQQQNTAPVVTNPQRMYAMQTLIVEVLSDGGEHKEVGNFVYQVMLCPVDDTFGCLTVEYREPLAEIVDISARGMLKAHITRSKKRRRQRR